MKYFVAIGDDRQGPFTEEAIREKAKTGDVGPAFYEPAGSDWMRGSFMGLLTTCGLTFVGHPEVDPEEENTELGLHGRLHPGEGCQRQGCVGRGRLRHQSRGPHA